MRTALPNFRELFLNPKGIKITPTRNFEKPQAYEKYVNWNIVVHRAQKPLPKTDVAFKLEPYKFSQTKPEIKQYFEKLYGVNIKKVNTLNYMGKIRRNHVGGRYRERDFKKVYITFNEEIDSFFQKIDK